MIICGKTRFVRFKCVSSNAQAISEMRFRGYGSFSAKKGDAWGLVPIYFTRFCCDYAPHFDAPVWPLGQGAAMNPPPPSPTCTQCDC